MNSLRIEILKDDVSDRYPFWSEKRLGFINLKRWLLQKSVKRQLNERREVWGVGLWPNEEIENAARKIAHIFHEEYGIGMVYGKPIKVMQSDVSDLLPSDICVERELSWICQWDVTVDELIRVSTIVEKKGYTKFYIGMVLGRIQDLPIEEFYEDY